MSHKIKVFYIDDNSLKQLGELLNNETSRAIIKTLIEKECYTNELASKLNLPVNLVVYHLKKLEKLNLVDVTYKKIVKKGIDRRFFRIKSDIFIANTAKVKKSKTGLKKIFDDGVKFVSIAIAAIVSYIISGYYETSSEIWYSAEDADFITPTTEYPIIIALVIIILGLVIDRIVLFVKK